MTDKFEAMSIFCEDIRGEKSGQDTIIGIYPDNVAVEVLPFIFPKIGVYIRIRVAVDFQVTPLSVFIHHEGSPRDPDRLTVIDESFIKKSIAQSRAQGTSVTYLISRAHFQLLKVDGPVRLVVTVGSDKHSVESGSLNIQSMSAISPTALPPPSKESPPGDPAS